MADWEAETYQLLPREQYLPHTGGKGDVYRCRRCGLRIADEKDAVSNGTERFHFAHIQNIDWTTGKCVRCGLKLQLVNDSYDVTMYKEDGEQVFVKSPLRVSVLLFCSEAEMLIQDVLLDSEGNLIRDEKDEMTYTLRANKLTTAVINGMRGPLFDRIVPSMNVNVELDIRGRNQYQREPDWDKAAERMQLYDSEYGKDYIKLHSRPKLASSTAMPWQTADICYSRAVDLWLIIKSSNSSDHALEWTGVSSQMEELILAQAWRSSGGNVLFGDWGLPIHSELTVDMNELIAEFRGQVTRYTPGVRRGRRMREVHGENYCIYEANGQFGFADLAERGHYLYFWPFEEGIPESAVNKIQQHLMHPYPWQSLAALPPAFFTPQMDFYGWGFSDKTYQHRPLFTFIDPHAVPPPT